MTSSNQQIPVHSVPAGNPVEADDDLRTRVTIRRDSPADAQQRQVLIRLDDGPTSTLLYGDRVTIDVLPGQHLLRVNNTLFWKRERFSIEPGEHLEFVIINRAGRMTLGLLALMGVAPLYLEIERRAVR